MASTPVRNVVQQVPPGTGRQHRYFDIRFLGRGAPAVDVFVVEIILGLLNMIRH